MMHVGHRVENMREHPCSRFHTGHCLFIGGIGMADRYGDSFLHQFAYCLERAIQLRCQRYQPERCELHNLLERLALGEKSQWRMGTETLGGNERSFEMHAQNS